MKKLSITLIAGMIFLAACQATPSPTLTPTLVTPTASPSVTPTFTATPTRPTSTPTLVMVEGMLTIKVNVRSGPGTGFGSLGQLNAGEKVQVLAKDNSGTWYLVLYPAAADGRGWVAAQYVTIPQGTAVPLDATATPTGPTGQVVQRLNVRSGPGTSFSSLGMLEPKTVVLLTGKNSTASWFQIDYASAPGGRGWVTAQYIQTASAADLPVLDDYGTPQAPTAAGTASGPALTPTITLGPAVDDGDSQAHPVADVTFASAGPDRFTYSSQVSAPAGDGEDWVAFTPFALTGSTAHIIFSLTCTGSGSLTVELWQAGTGTELSNWGSLACGAIRIPIDLPSGLRYELRLSPAPADGLRLVEYVLTVQNMP